LLRTAAHCDLPPACCAALSAWLPLRNKVPIVSQACASTSVFAAHGTGDELVKLELGQLSKQRIEEAGVKVEWHDYPMGHTACEPELQHLAQFLRRVLPPK
jgi:phospholipase/carboxylesterase